MSTVTVDHWHQAGIIRHDHAGKVTITERFPASIQHLHPHRDDRPHVHQVCIHEPPDPEYECPTPLSSRAGEPPLLFNSAEDPERTQREGIRNLGRRRQRELGIEGQT